MRSKVFTLLALLLTCTFTSMAQRVTVPSGFYWIYSDGYYLQPSSTSPYVTTARGRSPQAADIWKITSISEGDYTIRNFSTGATLVVPINANLPNLVMDDASRAQLVSNPTTHDYYTQNVIFGSSLQSVMIYPDNAGLNNLYSYSPSGYSHTTALSSGLIYLGKDNNPISYASRWTIEEAAVLEPSIDLTSVSGSTGTVTISPTELYDSDHIEYRYTTDGHDATTSSTLYTAPFSVTNGTVVHAIAVVKSSAFHGETIESKNAEKTINFSTTPIHVSSSTDIINQGLGGSYILDEGFTINEVIGTSANPFTGTIDGQLHTIASSSVPLVAYANGATIKNVIIGSVNISSGNNEGDAGAICCKAYGASRIYNCGLLGGTVGGSHYVGGLVGLLDGTSRVINCYSYADITGGTNVAGIVGYNNVTTTSANNNQKTMVMNCMFYGDITGGTTISPIYGGTIISNAGNTGVGNYNYFRLEAPYVQPKGVTYNCALGAEDRFLQRFEFFRHLLNGHRELAGWWATGTYSKSEMFKWVLLPDSIGTDHPYPILMEQGKYPSVVNIDAEHAISGKPRNQGGKLGTLTVNIRMGDGAVYSHPGSGANEAKITTTQLTLNITDKDPDHFNFNYYKVQLPYYNDVGTKNYTGNRVVTGWKIVSITGGTPGTFTTSDTWGGYNFADRNCTNKDLYGTGGSNRIFNQGAYWDVPEGVTAITIEPYWAKCAYLADQNADKVYSTDMKTGYDVSNIGGGQIYTNGNSYSIAGENQKVFTSMSNAIASNNSGLFAGVTTTNHTPYDYAVVLVGNYHNYNSIEAGNGKPYTVTSIDLDGDNEPDYSYILRFDSRKALHPVRVDFINIPGLGMAQKSTGGTGSYNFGIFQPKYWFESTNTSLFRVTQFEYDNSGRVAAPYIVQGGVIEQWVSGQSGGVGNKITYFHVGGNVWFKEFHRGTHQDATHQTNHPPVSVTGGDYDEFYLTGLYTANVTSYADNAECYINGGRFGTVCGAAMEGIGKANGADNTGNITWQIQNADIREFYAGGLNADKSVTGNLSTTIVGSYVDIFCGGPKFGDMSTGKTVTTDATNCTFGTFFGAGYGGNSYSRQAPRNHNNIINFPHNDTQGAGNDASWNAWLARFYTQEYNATYGGVSTQFSYQFLPVSSNDKNVARIFVDYVKFSLATCHTVTSTLTGCTVTGNYYGGGSLGKVDGNVTSTLNNCTMKGNVFGAGFSASYPTVQVDAIGFEIEPYYYEQLGTYRTGVKYKNNSSYAPTTYTWEHGDAISIDKTNHILYTTEDLSKTNLGSVNTATLTLTGNTTVGTQNNSDTGNVYGGGDESAVTNNTTVTIEGNSNVLGNVFGGGNRGPVGGNSEVKILDSSKKAK